MQYKAKPIGLRGYGYFSSTDQLYRNQNSKTMTVEGNANITVKPDQAILTIGVITENMNIQAAQHENSLNSNRIITALKQAGIEQDDIKTTVYSVNPRYDEVEGKLVFRGYEVRHLLQITVVEISNIGMIYDIAIKNGANYTESPEFQHSQSDLYYLQVLSMAVNNAQEKAQQIAKTLGVLLNGVPQKITEVSSQPTFYTQSTPRVFALAPTAPPIQPGELTFNARITAIFEYF